MSRRPHRYVGEFGVVQISVATDDCIGFGCAGKHYEIVVLRVAGCALDRRWVIVHRRMTFKSDDELLCARLVEPAAKPGSQQHPAQLGDQMRARDNLEPVIDPSAEDPIGRRSARANQNGDEDSGIDNDPDHALPRRSWRAADSSS